MIDIIDLDDVRNVFDKIRAELFILDDGLTEEELLEFCREWWNEELVRYKLNNREE